MESYGRAGRGYWTLVKDAAGMEGEAEAKRLQDWLKATMGDLLIKAAPDLSLETRRGLILVDKKVRG